MKTTTFFHTAALLAVLAMRQSTAADNSSGADTSSKLKAPMMQADADSAALPEVDVVARLNEVRDEIVPALGATEYSVTREHLESQSQGDNAPFNQTILRLPGVAQDSYGQLHVRGEHANLQYRINDVLLPEGISGFGQELSTRFVDHLSLITGALPAQFGDRTAGIVDIHTRDGSPSPGGQFSMYGGSFDTINPSFEYSGASGRLTYYFTGSFLHDSIGIENPTASRDPIHDATNQFKSFASLSYIIDDTSRLNLILSGGHSDFQIPNNPGQPQNFTLAGVPFFDSSDLNENQTEQNYYGILSYQKRIDDLNFQLSAFSRYSGVLFTPDYTGDLIFNGVASRVDRSIFSNGAQWDASYKLDDHHTIRGGLAITAEQATANTSDLVFATDSTGTQTGFTPFGIPDDNKKHGYLYGVYLQDEWKLTDQLTVNYGGRFDMVRAFVNESQFSPRINLVYTPTETTTLHAGYARYFTPPPLELVNQESVLKFANTTNAAGVTRSSPVKSERSHYFDAGITQKITPEFQAGLDTYYKMARNQLDEGQFGNALVFSPFNYDKGEIYGAEFTADYQKGGFSAYVNVAYSHAMGTQITSGEFQFGQDELDYIASHWVHLDHDQRWSASTGVSYTYENTRGHADLLYGSGLRDGFANTSSLPAYATVNIGIEHTFKLPGIGELKARFDIVNLFDKVYEIRDGSGIGVFAPQFGMGRGFYGGLSYAF